MINDMKNRSPVEVFEIILDKNSGGFSGFIYQILLWLIDGRYIFYLKTGNVQKHYLRKFQNIQRRPAGLLQSLISDESGHFPMKLQKPRCRRFL